MALAAIQATVVVKPWKHDLAYIREVGPDEPRFDEAVQRVWDRCEKLEAALRKIASRDVEHIGGVPITAQHIAREALTERGTTEASEGSEPGTPGHGSAERLSRPSTPRSVSADTEALLATVREATATLRRAADAKRPATADPMYDSARRQADEADVALDSLAAELDKWKWEHKRAIDFLDATENARRVTEAELERVKAKAERTQGVFVRTSINERTQAELERVKAERDENMAEALRWAERCNKALAALQEANQDVLLIDSPEGDSPRNIAANIRRAIAEIEGEATPHAITSDSDFGKIVYEDAERKPFDPQPIREDFPTFNPQGKD